MNRVFTSRVVFAAALSLGLLAFMQLGCEDQDPIGADGQQGPKESPVGNVPPETHLSLNFGPGEMPDTSRSRKVIHWWGEDSDGRVVSYQYRWGKLEFDLSGETPVITDTVWYDGDWAFIDEAAEAVWLSTPYERLEVTLPIRTKSATFTLEVRAVDNSGAIDPHPVSISFPVVNSRPEIDFRLASNPLTFTGREYTTFTTRSFVWDATDPDGSETIEAILWAMDPQPGDTLWQEVAGEENSLSLRDIELGEHVIWLKARDVAGFYSSPIFFPDPDNDMDPSTWRVKAPAPGKRLIVNDYDLDSADRPHLQLYKTVLEDVYGEGEDVGYSVWNLGTELPYVASDFTETLLMFDDIIWYSYYGQPLLLQAFNSMTSFINATDEAGQRLDKRMLLTTMTVFSGEEGINTGMLLDVAESAYVANPTRLSSRDDDPVIMQPAIAGLPEMQMKQLAGRALWGLNPSESAEVIYRLDESTSDPTQYDGTPVVGVRRPDKSYTLITLPIYLFTTRNNTTPEELDALAQLIEETFRD